MTNSTGVSIKDCITLINDNEFFKAMFGNMYEAAILLDANRKFAFWNKTAQLISGYANSDTAPGQPLAKGFTFFDSEGNKLKDLDCPISQCFNTGKVVNKKVLIKHKSGFLVPVLTTTVPMKDADHIVVGVLQLMLDDSAQDDLEKAHDKLKEATVRDGLTNLFTRSEIISRINIEVEKADRYEVPVCLCICDIDDLKVINDKYGNHVGDIIIRSMSELLITNLRRTDIIGRLAGGTFIVLLPLIDLHRANKAIQKLRSKVNVCEMDIMASEKAFMSYGITELNRGDSAEVLIDRAESALYKAKKLGKNRIEMFT
ncbi:MAG: diguanylate cyclase [Vampirovibrionia bacterium]